MAVKPMTYYGTCAVCGVGMRDVDEHGFVSMSHPDKDNPEQCFTCWFWGEHAWDIKDDRRVIVNGVHYTMNPSDLDPEGKKRREFGRGFSGARWEIEFFDGRKVVTHNLWHQGEIPEYWRTKNKYQDNAVFIKGTK